MAAIILNGTAGDRWKNDSQVYYYQFHCLWKHTCGACAQYHLAISTDWPIPLHRGCRCYADPIKPGQTARPWADFQEIAAKLNHENQVALVGAGNYNLIEKGVVKWSDVVTKFRVRDLHEVVSRNRLSIKQLEKAGIKPDIAQRAHATVNTPAHVLADQKRQELIRAILAKGHTKQQVAQAFGARMAESVQISQGPSGPQVMPSIRHKSTIFSMPHTPYLPLSVKRPRAIEQWAQDKLDLIEEQDDDPVDMTPSVETEGEAIPKRKRSKGKD